MPSIDTMVYALWLMYLKKLSNEYVQQVHVFFIQRLFVNVVSLLENNLLHEYKIEYLLKQLYVFFHWK